MIKVELSETAVLGFSSLPLGMKRRVQTVIERLERWPEVSGAKPLRHELKGHYRVRAGDWRIVFHVKADVLTVDRIDNRKDVYQ